MPLALPAAMAQFVLRTEVAMPDAPLPPATASGILPDTAEPLALGLNTEPFARYLNQVVVLDTQGPLIYMGTLVEVTPLTLVLRDADVHDCNDSRASKDLYLVETRDLGIRANRRVVLVMRSQVASASLLADIID